ncbi:hypothetical protein D7030_04560 [Flavobacteriaceae bacterium AU392]|nr:hypothetical protein D1817_11035 [Flavobacteriaceae bacterium]RKM85948.1 hypothetical protein D7030_04560 [Flavobacteriaceae bacterium AU392]
MKKIKYNLCSKFLIIIFTGFLFQTAQAQKDIKGSSKQDFLKMAQYLSEGSGKWMAPNPNYNPQNPSSHQAVGLWFDFKLEENYLRLSIVTYIGETAHIISSGMWIWHPGEQKIKFFEIIQGGRFTEAEVYFISDNTFVSRKKAYLPNGKIYFALGENIMLSKDKHKTISKIYENGSWRTEGSYVWKKTAENEGYETIKYD